MVNELKLAVVHFWIYCWTKNYKKSGLGRWAVAGRRAAGLFLAKPAEQCNHCHKQYIGETKRRLKIALTNIADLLINKLAALSQPQYYNIFV